MAGEDERDERMRFLGELGGLESARVLNSNMAEVGTGVSVGICSNSTWVIERESATWAALGRCLFVQ